MLTVSFYESDELLSGLIIEKIILISCLFGDAENSLAKRYSYWGRLRRHPLIVRVIPTFGGFLIAPYSQFKVEEIEGIVGESCHGTVIESLPYTLIYSEINFSVFYDANTRTNDLT